MIFAADSIHFMASKKKIEFLRQTEQNKDENSVPPVKLYIRNKVTPFPFILHEFGKLLNVITLAFRRVMIKTVSVS